jgi:microcystin-dependent protein
MSPGLPLSGIGIPANAVVLSVDSATQVTMSANATASATTPLVFAPYGVGDGTSTFGIPNRAYVAVGRDNVIGSASNITQVSTTLTIGSGSSTGTVASAAGLAVGMYASQPKFASGTKITAISGVSITFSNAATAAQTGAGIRFSPVLDAQTMGATGGSLTHAITIPEVPTITPTASASSTFSGGNTVVPIQGTGTPGSPVSAALQGNNTGGATSLNSPATGSVATSVTVNSFGGRLAHSISQPMIVVNFMIKR